jgi:hypothetical protein
MLLRVKRRRMASVSAVPRRSAEAYFTISSYLLTDQFPVDRPGQDVPQVGIDVGFAGDGTVEALPADVLQPRQQLESEQAAEGERDLALAVTIDVLAIDRHLRAMADHALDHRRDLRRRRTFQLRVDAQALLFDMPVDHDPAPAVADVPLRGKVLIPGAEVFGVGGTSGCSIAPDRWVAGVQRAVGHGCNRVPEPVGRDIAAARVGQIPIARPAVARGVHAFQAGVGAEPVQAQQQARGRSAARSSVS